MKAYIIDITFEDLHPRVWRRVVLPANATFNRLHETIQHITNFQSILEPYHYFAFPIDGLFITNNEAILEEYKGKSYAGGKVRVANRIKIDNYLEEHKQLTYTYDFGDDWHLTIELQEIVEDYYFGYPTLLAFEGTAPPEDVGGPGGYEHFLSVMHDPTHPEHEHLQNWAQMQRYKPTDITSINSNLKVVKYQKTEWNRIHHENHKIISDKYRGEQPSIEIETADSTIMMYALAFSNLYGYIEFPDFVRIYNEQNKEQITVEQLVEELKKADLATKGIQITADALMHEVLQNINLLAFQHEISKKPFHVPAKEELLKYINASYYEKTSYQQMFAQMIARDFYGGSTLMVQQEIDEIVGLLQVIHSNPQQIMQDFVIKHRMQSAEQINRYAQIITLIGNTTRIWENRGHTPDEYFRLAQPVKTTPTEQPATKVGRNDPCHCGSDKKYKKCCGN